MRFPLAKVYRAFPELDSFSDGECERFVRAARGGRRISHLFSFVAGAMCGIVLVAVLYSPFYRFMDFLLEHEMPEWLTILCGVCGGLALLLSPWVGALLGRDFWLRRAIRKQLRRTTCPRCRYSLLGLAVVGDGSAAQVLCPECGSVTRLADHALTAAELMAVPGSGVGGDRGDG